MAGFSPRASLCGVLVFVLAALASPAKAQIVCDRDASIATELVMRGAPAKDSAFVAKVVRGDVVSVCRFARREHWVLVRFRGEMGWLPQRDVLDGLLNTLPRPRNPEPPASAMERRWCQLHVVAEPVTWRRGSSEDTLVVGEVLAQCRGVGWLRQADGLRGDPEPATAPHLKPLGKQTPAVFPFGGGQTCREHWWSTTVIRERSPRTLRTTDGEFFPHDLPYGAPLMVAEERDGWLRSWWNGEMVWFPADMVAPPASMDLNPHGDLTEIDCPTHYRSGVVSRSRARLYTRDGTLMHLPLNILVDLPIACTLQRPDDVLGDDIVAECVPEVVKLPNGRFYRTSYLGHQGLVRTREVAVTLDPGAYRSWRVRHREVRGVDPADLEEEPEPTAPEVVASASRARRVMVEFLPGVRWGNLAGSPGRMNVGVGLALDPEPWAPGARLSFGSTDEDMILGGSLGTNWEPFQGPLHPLVLSVGGYVTYEAVLGLGENYHVISEELSLSFGWREDRVTSGVSYSAGLFQRLSYEADGGLTLGMVHAIRFAVGVTL